MAQTTVMSRAEVDESTLAEIAEACNVTVNQIEDVYSCTHMQIDMIAGTRVEVFRAVLNFGPGIDIDRFCEALRQVVSLNSILRTRFVNCRLGIVQVVTSEEHITLRQSGDIEKYLRDDEKHHLRWNVPVFRSTFINEKFVATLDHTIMDNWSLIEILNDDVVACYCDLQPKRRSQFKEFVAHCMSIDESTAKSFWASRFKGVPAIFPRVSPGFSPHGKQKETRKVDLKRIGNGVLPAHVPPFTEAAWALTAGMYADSDSVTFGIVLSGRSSDINGIQTSLGPLNTEVPVQVNLQRNMTIERLIKDRATSLRQLQTNPALHYGGTRIAAVNEAARIASGFQTLLNIRPPVAIRAEERNDLISFERMVMPEGPFTLNLACNILDDGILVDASSDPAIICEPQLHRILNQFEHTLRLLTELPLQTKLDQLQLLSPHDLSEILQWNKTIPEAVEKCVHELFHARALAQPEAMAVEASDGSASYFKLDQMSDRLAHELQRKGVSSGMHIALIFEKSLWSIVAVLGIMKAGGACVPIDKDDLDDRKAAIISSAHAKIVLTSSAEHENSVHLAPEVFTVSAESIDVLPDITVTLDNGTSSPEDLAYILFTSGSTKDPKGTMLEHRCLVSSLTSVAHRLGWQKNCRMLQLATDVSHISMSETFGTLLFGGCLCIPSEEARKSHLSGYIESAKVNWALLPPRVLRIMSPNEVSGLKSLLSIGEPVDTAAAKTWGGALRFFNGWGACETSISTVAELTPGSHYPESIGTPVGCAAWIVNPQNSKELTPIGGVGELLIEGPGVARGYLNNEGKTATSFIPPPPWASSCNRMGTRFYRTGDLAKYNPDGSISFVGRKDNRVKLGGQKVQLEELESVIASCREVRDVVTSTKISAGRTNLLAVVCLTDPQLPQSAVLRKLPDIYAELAEQRLNAVRIYAKSRLPSDKVPTIWLAVEHLPRTALERLDRAAIREWLKSQNPSTRSTTHIDALK